MGVITNKGVLRYYFRPGLRYEYMMYRLSLVPLVLLCWVNPLLGQNQPLAEYEALSTYIKVWGLLKYHHPGVTNGKLDWDQVFMVHVNEAIAADEYDELKAILNKLFRECEKSKQLKNKTYQLDTMNKLVQLNEVVIPPQLDAELLQKLKQLIRSPVKNSYYLRRSWLQGVPTLRNEPDSFSHNVPNKEAQLLAMARYWNYMNFFNPYQSKFPVDWDKVLIKYLPKMLQCSDTDYYLILWEFCAEIHDSHFVFRNDLARDLVIHYYPPFKLRLVDSFAIIQRIDTSIIKSKFSIQPGDTIIYANGISVDSLVSYCTRYFKGANSAATKRNINYWLFRTLDADRVNLQVLRNGKLVGIDVPLLKERREWPSNVAAKPYRMLNDSTVFIRIFSLTEDELDKLLENEQITRIILDIERKQNREYSYNRLVHRLLKEKTLYAINYYPNPQPGYFFKRDNYVKPKGKTIERDIYVFVMVDEHTQSATEELTLLLQSLDNVKAVGSQTAGALAGVVAMPLPGGVTVLFTGDAEAYPDGQLLYHHGVKIDIETELEGEELLEFILQL